MHVDIGYALTDSRDLVEERPLEGRALHRGTLRWTLLHPAWGSSATLRGSWVGSRPFYIDEDGDGVEETQDAAPYTMLDIRLGQDLFEDRVSLFAGVDNLLQAGDAAWLPVPPRTFYAGLNGRYR